MDAVLPSLPVRHGGTVEDRVDLSYLHIGIDEERLLLWQSTHTCRRQFRVCRSFER
jgi:hypothetical protein